MKIAVIDYEMGNLKSVTNALSFLGAKPIIVKKPSRLRGDKIIVPGVGAFGKASQNLRPFGSKIEESLESNIPLLGICLGLQIFLEESDESPTDKGLALMKGKVRKIETNLKLPLIGWNNLEIKKKNCPLFKGVEGGYVYFVHSYEAVPEEDVVAATTEYGRQICASVWKNNVYGTQFHPEKSGKLGLEILRNFLEL